MFYMRNQTLKEIIFTNKKKLRNEKSVFSRDDFKKNKK